jgi:hypothetical protein
MEIDPTSTNGAVDMMWRFETGEENEDSIFWPEADLREQDETDGFSPMGPPFFFRDRPEPLVSEPRKNNLTPKYAEPNSRPGMGRATSESIAEWFEVGRPVPGRQFDPVTLF